MIEQPNALTHAVHIFGYQRALFVFAVRAVRYYVTSGIDHFCGLRVSSNRLSKHFSDYALYPGMFASNRLSRRARDSIDRKCAAQRADDDRLVEPLPFPGVVKRLDRTDRL